EQWAHASCSEALCRKISLQIQGVRPKSVRQDEVDDGAEAHAGGAFREPGLGIVVPNGAGDVQMNPGGIAGKFLDEHGADGRARAFATADVLNVGDGSLYEFAILFVDRHLPQF